jgi:hypothetical protein
LLLLLLVLLLLLNGFEEFFDLRIHLGKDRSQGLPSVRSFSQGSGSGSEAPHRAFVTVVGSILEQNAGIEEPCLEPCGVFDAAHGVAIDPRCLKFCGRVVLEAHDVLDVHHGTERDIFLFRRFGCAVGFAVVAVVAAPLL